MDAFLMAIEERRRTRTDPKQMDCNSRSGSIKLVHGKNALLRGHLAIDIQKLGQGRDNFKGIDGISSGAEVTWNKCPANCFSRLSEGMRYVVDRYLAANSRDSHSLLLFVRSVIIHSQLDLGNSARLIGHSSRVPTPAATTFDAYAYEA